MIELINKQIFQFLVKLIFKPIWKNLRSPLKQKMKLQGNKS